MIEQEKKLPPKNRFMSAPLARRIATVLLGVAGVVYALQTIAVWVVEPHSFQIAILTAAMAALTVVAAVLNHYQHPFYVVSVLFCLGTLANVGIEYIKGGPEAAGANIVVIVVLLILTYFIHASED